MGELAALVKKHPEMLGLAVIVVVLLAWFQSRKNGTGTPSDSGAVAFSGGGVTNATIDPNAAAIEEARIGANSANLTTLSQLWLGINEASFSRDVAEGQTSAALSSSLAQTEASRVVGLAQLDTQRDIANYETGAQIQTARISADVQTTQAQINSGTARALADSNVQALTLDNQRQAEINATQRDIARVEAKQGFWSNLIHGAEGIAAIAFGG
jgi:uncharacterized protein (DUF1800 family)